MKKLTLVLLALASLMGTASVASAQYYGGGYYYDYPQYYHQRYRYYDYDDYRYRRHRYYLEHHDVYGRRCPYNWTVQDGVCKPYRGY